MPTHPLNSQVTDSTTVNPQITDLTREADPKEKTKPRDEGEPKKA